MAVNFEEFVKAVSDSGLIEATEVQAFLAYLPPDKKPETAEGLARELVRHKRLTSFQAKAIYQGKASGLVVGNYVILDILGQGGMGYVYKAKHKPMKRVVALKMISPRFTKSQLRRFQREAEAAARLIHPNIVTAFDADKAGDIHFLAMEYVEGLNLGDLVKERGPLPVNEAVNYICQAAGALEYAHGQKVVHRDVKPENLLLNTKGSVKVLDMGLARFEQRAGPEDSTYSSSLTHDGLILGTVDYMPPEQVTSPKSADRRADIYSLGCTLFYLLTGRAVYGGDELIQRIMAHREQPIPSLCAIREDIPPALDAVFQRMVAKSVEDRHQSMTEVVADLQASLVARQEQFDGTTTFRGLSPSGIAAKIETQLEPLETVSDWLKADMPESSSWELLLTDRRQTRRVSNVVIVAAAVVTVVVIVSLCLLI